jgi:hypothetical protein
MGFSFSAGLAAVAWDAGDWCLIYRIDELMGAELLVDGQVIGRVYRGEQRRAIDQVVNQAAQVTLRLVFDDPRHPDFELDLWRTGDEQRRESRSPADAIQEANRWLARADAIVRRPIAPRGPSPIVQKPASEPAPASAPAAPPAPAPEPPKPEPVQPPVFDDVEDDDLDPPFALEAEPVSQPEPVRSPPPPNRRAAPVKEVQDELPFDLDDDDDDKP